MLLIAVDNDIKTVTATVLRTIDLINPEDIMQRSDFKYNSFCNS